MGFGGVIEDFAGSFVQLSDAWSRAIGRSLAWCGQQAFTTIQEVHPKPFRNDEIAVLPGDIENDAAKIALRARPDFELK
jgi:hypothetical protein